MGMFDFLSKEPKKSKSKVTSHHSAKKKEKVEEIPSFDFDTEGADDELPVFPSIEDLDDHEGDAEDYKEHIKDIEVEEIDQRDDLSLTKPIFMSVHLYKELIDELGQMKDRFSEAGTTIENVEKLNDDSERYYNRWKNQVENIHNKLIYIDETLFKGR